MSDIKNVIILGAGGNLGPSVLQAFLDDASFNVTVLSREGSTSTFPSGVKVVRADYSSPDSLKNAFQGQDAVLALVASHVLADQVKLIDAAIAAGVKRFIPSEFGSNTADQRLLDIVPAFRGKKATIDYLKTKEDSISWSGVITGAFFDWGLKVGFLGLDATSKTATLVDEGKAPISVTNLYQIGLALVKILQKPSETKNQYIYVSSFETSQAELLTAAEKITREKWSVKHVTSKELIETGNAKLQKQDFSGIVDLIRGGVFSDEHLGDSRPAGLWNDRLGLKKEDFEASVKTGLSGKLVNEK